MIFLNDTNDFAKYFDTEKNFLNDSIKAQEITKSVICKYMQNFADTIDDIDSSLASDITRFFECLKTAFNACNDNLVYLNSLSANFDDLSISYKNSSNTLSENINSFNLSYIDLNQKIIENNIKISECLSCVSEKSRLHFSSTVVTVNDSSINTETSKPIELTVQDKKNAKLIELSSETNQTPESIQDYKYIDNTLLISEMSGNVVLPYTQAQLDELLKNAPNKYTSTQDIIEQEYTLPISLFKNASIARFRETFKLMRNREKASIKDAFELSLELTFNYNLHPAIISACKNLDELDIYLDYLETGETDKFDCFKIVFEFPPAVVHKNTLGF